MEASRSQFACANPEKSAKTKQRLARIITEEEQKLQFNRSKAMPAPPRKIVRTTLVLVQYQVLFDTDRYLNFVRYSILDTYVASLIFTENTVPSRNSMQQK